ncbi:hypothetical protein OAT16_05270 [Prolixibacteraceae bacterium]|nr:hypothetical protein [Prolixibacteraceae bacterium]
MKKIILLLVLVPVQLLVLAEELPRKPNIVLIMADDVGWESFEWICNKISDN